MYHFLIVGRYDITHYIEKVKADQDGDIKINVGLGFILKHIESGELRFFHPSNNSNIYNETITIETEDAYKKLAADLEKEDLFEYASTRRPSTKWKVVKLVCIRFEVYKL